MGGFSASGATVVIFIGLLICAGMVLPVASNVWSQTQASHSAQHDKKLMLDNTDFTVDAEWEDQGGDGEYGVNLTNTGTTTLEIRAVTYQLDGAIAEPDEQFVVVGEDEFFDRVYLQPGESLVAEFSLGEEPDRLHVTIETGQSQSVVQ